ncbi:MAG: hypothetical protein ACI9FB_001374 [Candidatus Azotimanducaceae bacterium]|jgi:hypothetical protein
MIHLLHIGKTGGTALRYALRDVPDVRNGYLVLHTHNTRLQDIPNGDKVIFFLREPLSRFYSGFYSRKRNGRPRYNSEWSDQEALAFGRFESPMKLLDFAISGCSINRQNATEALETIGHVKDHYTYWLRSVEYLEARKDDILHIGFLDSFSEDFECLKSKLGLPSEVALPTSSLDAHVNPEYEQPALCPAQQFFFDEWFARDIELYQHCTQHFSTTR